MTNKVDLERDKLLEEAKKRMAWNVERHGREPTLLEYLRSYKYDDIKEIHIEAVIDQHLAKHSEQIEREARLDEINYAEKMVSKYGYYKHFELRKAELENPANLQQSNKEKV